MAGRHSGQHRTGDDFIANNLLAGCHCRQCSAGWNMPCVHGLADHILTQHRRRGGLAIAAAGKGVYLRGQTTFKYLFVFDQ
jgi:hypothetical protein